jgi:hypothetical protein
MGIAGPIKLVLALPAVRQRRYELPATASPSLPLAP